MDFVAEIVLGYTDSELVKRLRENSIDDYKILRYRDDYRIFTKNSQDGEVVLKLLTETLIDLGMRLNPPKTLVSNDVIRESIKPDKLFWTAQKQRKRNLQKHLLMIHDLATRFPNSGSLQKALTDYHKRIQVITKKWLEREMFLELGFHKKIRSIKKQIKSIKEALIPLISIITDIAYHNPKVYAVSSAILSEFIELIENDGDKKEIISRIKKRLDRIPNTGHMEIWLQRITVTFDEEYTYKERLCEIVASNSFSSHGIWDFTWLDEDFRNKVERIEIVDRKKMVELPPVVSPREVEFFIMRY